MTERELDALRVDVPVGFLLTEAREITLSVDRPDDEPLAIRLRLIPAQADEAAPRMLSAVPLRSARRVRAWEAAADGYPLPDFGGGD